jgi:hypothetical protein
MPVGNDREATAMAYGLIYEFPSSVGEAEYEAVNAKLGIDSSDANSAWPEGLITHASGPAPDGAFWLFEVWESKARQEAFMSTRLGAALAAVGVPAPTQVVELDLVNHQELG